jgi:hypothetical protein
MFGRDMFLDIPLLADLMLIRDRRHHIIDENLHRTNLERRFCDYKVGDEVSVFAKAKKELRSRLEPTAPAGPFVIIRVHVNGIVTIALQPHISERINIRRIRPYRR